jgi:DNA-binding GntR family transcriptional regulator
MKSPRGSARLVQSPGPIVITRRRTAVSAATAASAIGPSASAGARVIRRTRVARPADDAAAPTDAQMHARIVQALLDQRLTPGTRLPEDELGAVFGVSRTRVRQLLIRLASERLVTLRPNAGARVADPTPAEAREVFNARRLIEPSLAAACATRVSRADLSRLSALIEDEEVQRVAGDRGAAIRLAGDFHLAMAELAGDATLERFARELVSRTSLVLMRFGPKDLREAAAGGGAGGSCRCLEHRGLLAAMRLRDGAAAARLMVEHLQRLESQLVFDDARSPARPLAELLGSR